MFEPPLYRHPPLQCMVNTIKLIYVIICTCSKILAHVIYIDKYYKAYIRRHIFYLAIFLTIFTLSPFLFNYNKILLIRLKLIFKKIHALTLRRYFKKYTVWTQCKAFLATFNINLSHIFGKNFHWNSSNLSENTNFYFFCFYLKLLQKI